ncbi:MAG: hypothetical protein A2493_01140 [Candidatus Magasanikbacteria bacterium RIFOXYC12_FULL_33_11]|uniref:CARDB domain-containing protein n=1 Tax=Candidatus Magasanikbacteria bacterium RIFOXYC12_FULL_33_11 TaxID=1798701 RepID=A0A1F6NNG1_9BACT|nr:MAG: hypothetical protein A2493_01140 [Candidatus Magasanikbacteria bacterium RIFOXYC12_FULL_33_11]
MDEQKAPIKVMSKSKTKMAIAVGFLGLAALAAGFAGLRFKGNPDLAFKSSGESVVQTADGTFNRFSYTVKNFGSGTSATPFQLNIKLGDGTSVNSVKQIMWLETNYATPNEPVGNYQVMNSDDGSFSLPLNDTVIYPGGENRVFYWFVLPSTYTASDLKVQYTVDYLNSVRESNENNNFMSQTFDVAGLGLSFEGSSPEQHWCLNLDEDCLLTTTSGKDPVTGENNCDTMTYLFPSEANCQEAGMNYDWEGIETPNGNLVYQLVSDSGNGQQCSSKSDCGVGGGCGPCVSGQQECTFSTGACLESGSCEVSTEVRTCTAEPIATTTQEYWCLNFKEQCLLSSPAGISPIDGSANCQGKEGGRIYYSEESCQQAGATFDWVPVQGPKGPSYDLVTSTTAIFCSSNNDCGVGGGCSECVNGNQNCSSSNGKCLSTGVCEVSHFSQACTNFIFNNRR